MTAWPLTCTGHCITRARHGNAASRGLPLPGATAGDGDWAEAEVRRCSPAGLLCTGCQPRPDGDQGHGTRGTSPTGDEEGTPRYLTSASRRPEPRGLTRDSAALIQPRRPGQPRRDAQGTARLPRHRQHRLPTRRFLSSPPCREARRSSPHGLTRTGNRSRRRTRKPRPPRPGLP